ncbi:hypothetical protein CVT24_012698 [Panaeolus cyanescens]|uniref:Uncharacterized protein n=1 Tax=Panaeolus cyanescens TaxID=181874 RepID=A0A409YK30_9AGAR|nr:hypothetical protein CVT24_012698 [Panaeolus cyanescens]
MLENLSDDIVLHIATHLTTHDHRRLRLVSNGLSNTLALLVLKSVRISIKSPVNNSQKQADSLALLRWLATAGPDHHTRLRAIRKLSVISLSPSNDIAYKRSSREGGVEIEDVHKPMEDEIIGCLRPALLNLENVHDFSWEVQAKDPVITHTIVAEAVSSYQHLETLHVYLTHLTTPVLHHFKNLLSIEYSTYLVDQKLFIPSSAVDSFAQALINSPKLRSFTFTATRGQEHILNNILEKCRINNVVLPLQNLTMHRIPSAHSLVPHVGNLNSIDINMMDIPTEDQDNTSLALDGLWRAILHKGLPRPSVLHVMARDKFAPDDVDAHAERFYFEALPMHCATLQILDMRRKFVDKWGFSRGLVSVVKQCTALRRLGLGFRSDDDDRQEGIQVDGQDKPALVSAFFSFWVYQMYTQLLIIILDSHHSRFSIRQHDLLDSILDNCPRLRVLDIYQPYPASHNIYWEIPRMQQLIKSVLLSWVGRPHNEPPPPQPYSCGANTVPRMPSIFCPDYGAQICFDPVVEEINGIVSIQYRRRIMI